MENTDENVMFCWNLIQPFLSLKRLPAEHRIESNMQYLAQTLVDACSSQRVAEEVVERVMSKEEEFPAPATLRKALRDLDYVEQDVQRKRQERSRLDSAEQDKRVAEGRM
jgi:hypothetical protein